MRLTNGKCKKKFVLAPIKYRRCYPRAKADSLYDNICYLVLSWKYLVFDWTKLFIITNDFFTIFSITLKCDCLCMSWNRPRQWHFIFHNPRSVRYKANPITDLDRHWGFQEDESPTFQDNRHMNLVSYQPYPPAAFPHFCERLSQPQVRSAAAMIRSNKNSNGTIWNRTRDHPACSAVP